MGAYNPNTYRAYPPRVATYHFSPAGNYTTITETYVVPAVHSDSQETRGLQYKTWRGDRDAARDLELARSQNRKQVLRDRLAKFRGE